MYLLALWTLLLLMQFSADRHFGGRWATGSIPERAQVTMVKEGLLSLVQSSRPGKAWAEEKGRRGRRRGRLKRRRRAAAAAAVAGEMGT